MSSLTEEEENYIRMSLLLKTLSPRAVRASFDKEFPPTFLPSMLNKEYNKLLSLQKNRVINQAQWSLLFPSRLGVADSKTFDVTLLICLIRNLSSLTPPALGFDRLPPSRETTPGADLARIKYYRNHLAHSDDNMKISNSDFTTAWNDISDAVQRLGGPAMYQECQDLKTKILDKSTIPWNIREQITTQLESWKTDDQMFVDTRAASHVLQTIISNSCVTVTASSGVGKTFTVRHVALQIANDGYDIVPVTNPEDISKFHNPNKKMLYVIDDLCGTYTLNQTYFDKWKTMHEHIERLLKNDGTKIIASCRLQVFQDEQFKLLPLFTACECNLLLPNMSLSQEEKQLIAEKYLKSDASKICQYIDLFDFFPLLCRLYNEDQTVNIVEFFKNPFSVYEEEIDRLNTKNAYGKYCALALCVMFNNQLKEEWLTDDVNQDIKQIIENTCEACKLNRCTSRLVLQDELDLLTHSFLKKENGCYSTIHDKLFDFLSFYFGNTKMIQCVIKNADCRLVSERFVFEKTDGSDQFTILIPNKYQKLYIDRMIDDWSMSKVIMVFSNINMKLPKFRNALLIYLRNLDKMFQIQLATKGDELLQNQYVYQRYISKIMNHWIMTTPLLNCCALGYFDMVEWCCFCGADVNYCNDNEESPLYTACKGGYSDIVTKLVDNKADINKCTTDGESPLYAACERGYTDIVTKLVDNNADINKCTTRGKSPLYIACERGYTDIVTKLVDNNADINNCKNWYDQTPLYIACARGYTDIVNKLVDSKADINTCTTSGDSPLYIACKRGYTDIVTKLVDNKADINWFSPSLFGNWESPLYVACEGGYKDIVTKLVDSKADINYLTGDGQSPLYIACKNGYTDIVSKLVDNKADVNKCSYSIFGRGESPLFIACKGGYTDIVTKLVDNKADINKCTGNGESSLYFTCVGAASYLKANLMDSKAAKKKFIVISGETPLYRACKEGFTDIVTKLLDINADINKCTVNGESPLYVACYEGYTDIVTKLLDNKADITKYTDYGASPLSAACNEGYTDIVTKLLNNKADINYCTSHGESPLHLACKHGFIQIVEILITKGADHTKYDQTGQSPLDVAKLSGHDNIVECITRHSLVQ